jgi:hypothetical protein
MFTRREPVQLADTDGRAEAAILVESKNHGLAGICLTTSIMKYQSDECAARDPVPR